MKSLLNRFRTASATVDKHKEILGKLENDFRALMSEGGIGAVQAEPKFQFRAAQLIRQAITDEFSLSDPTPMFIEQRNARLGDSTEWETVFNPFRVVNYSPHSDPLIFTPTKAKYTITTSGYALDVGIELTKIMSRMLDMSQFASFQAQALRRHKLKLVLEAIDTACAAGVVDKRGRAVRTAAAGSDVAQQELDDAIRRMRQYNTGLKLVGQGWALDPVMDYTKTDGGDALKDEFQRRGVLGFYRGVTLIQVNDDHSLYEDTYTTINGVDWEQLLVLVANEVGAIHLERDLSPLDFQDLNAERGYFRASMRFDHGVFVHAPWRYHVIELQQAS